VAERGVLTAPAEVWDVAVRRSEVVGRLAGLPMVGAGCRGPGRCRVGGVPASGVRA